MDKRELDVKRGFLFVVSLAMPRWCMYSLERAPAEGRGKGG